jgi:uncharacterized membrane protein
MAFALTLVGAALACALELLEALAIVLAVALERRPRDALIGAAAAVVLCLAVGVVLGPALTGQVALAPLRIVIGVALLLFGMEWLRKGVLRMAGRRRRSSSWAEFEEERAELASEPPAPDGSPDWAARTVAFKGVLLEGMEVVLIISALAARPGGRAPALLGAALAVVATAGIGAVLHRPLRRVPETELKLLVGLVLTTFGTFFTGEGFGIAWPLGDGALLVIAAWWALVAFVLIRREAVR